MAGWLFDFIERLDKAQPSTFVKPGHEHWMWWLFPTELVGRHDTKRTAVLDAEDAQHLLQNGVGAGWITILTFFATAVRGRKTEAFPNEQDRGRINFFVGFWMRKDIMATVQRIDPDVAKALRAFADAWTSAHYVQHAANSTAAAPAHKRHKPDAPPSVVYYDAKNKDNFITKGANGLPMQWLRDKGGAVAVCLASNLLRPMGACAVLDEDYNGMVAALLTMMLDHQKVHGIDPNNFDVAKMFPVNTDDFELAKAVWDKYRECSGRAVWSDPRDLLSETLQELQKYKFVPLETETQEESVLSYLWANVAGAKRAISACLNDPRVRGHYPRLPTGTEADFLKGKEDVRFAGPELYRQQLGSFFCGGAPGSGCGMGVFMFAAPNAQHPGGAWPNPRPGDRLDTVYRSASKVCMGSYPLFREGVLNAIKAFLISAKQHDLQRAIIPAIGCGIYAGKHRKQIQEEFHLVCVEAITYVEAQCRPFKGVLVPRFGRF